MTVPLDIRGPMVDTVRVVIGTYISVFRNVLPIGDLPTPTAAYHVFPVQDLYRREHPQAFFNARELAHAQPQMVRRCRWRARRHRTVTAVVVVVPRFEQRKRAYRRGRNVCEDLPEVLELGGGGLGWFR